jgi:Ca2+-binding RTX toxin-like protein
MVFKTVTSPSQGDLFNPVDFFGVGNDILHLMIPTPNNTAIRTYQGNDIVAALTPASGSKGYKFLLGTGNDTLLGSNVDDEYYDEGGHDQIIMGDGSDHVYAGPGNDTIDGGSNTSGGGEIKGDFIRFGISFDMFGNRSVVTQGVTLDLASTTAQALGFYGNDTFLNFENVIGGLGNDHFSGSNVANYMDGDGGNDFLRGLAGMTASRGERAGTF